MASAVSSIGTSGSGQCTWEISMPVPGIAANSMLRSRNLAWLPILVGLLSCAVEVILVAHALLDVPLPCGLRAAGLRTVPWLEIGFGLVALAAGGLAERGGTKNNGQQKRTHDAMLVRARGWRISNRLRVQHHRSALHMVPP